MNSHGYSYGYSGPCSWAIHAPGTDSSSPSNIWGPTSHVFKVLYDFGIGWGRRGARRKCVTILAAHIWPTFSRHGPKCVTKIPGPPQQSADQKVLRIQNVSRMCHKKVWPKSTFWEVTNLGLEPADLVNEHVLRKVKGSFRNTLDEEVT